MYGYVNFLMFYLVLLVYNFFLFFFGLECEKLRHSLLKSPRMSPLILLIIFPPSAPAISINTLLTTLPDLLPCCSPLEESLIKNCALPLESQTCLVADTMCPLVGCPSLPSVESGHPLLRHSTSFPLLRRNGNPSLLHT